MTTPPDRSPDAITAEPTAAAAGFSPRPPAPARRSPILLVLFGLLVVAAIVAGWLLLTRSDPADAPAAASGTAAATSLPAGVIRDCATCPQMVTLPAGTVAMGSPRTEDGHLDTESPVHDVAIAPFLVSRFEVTMPEIHVYEDAIGRTVLHCTYSDRSKNSMLYPAACITFDDAAGYAAWLSQTTGKTYRLLSEAEWEYAARAGAAAAFPSGDNPADLCATANIRDITHRSMTNSTDIAFCDDHEHMAALVGAYTPNALGLYDMIGNLSEWVADCAHNDYAGAPTDGSPWTDACPNPAQHVVRGGSWNSPPADARSASRLGRAADYWSSTTGFRVAREP